MYTFIGNCAQLDGEAISEMKHNSKTITRQTLIRKVGLEQLRRIEAELGYETHPRKGLTMAGDFHVGYDRSTYQGRACVYFTWSAFEYVFVKSSEYARQFSSNSATIRPPSPTTTFMKG